MKLSLNNYKSFKEIGVDKNETVLDVIYLHSSVYKEIFNKKFKDDHYKPSKRGVVKLKCGKSKIYLRYYMNNAKDFTKDNFSVHPFIFQQLAVDNTEQIELLKGNPFRFYWNNPKDSVRLSTRLGYLSVLLGVISLFLGVISLI